MQSIGKVQKPPAIALYLTVDRDAPGFDEPASSAKGISELAMRHRSEQTRTPGILRLRNLGAIHAIEPELLEVALLE